METLPCTVIKLANPISGMHILQLFDSYNWKATLICSWPILPPQPPPGQGKHTLRLHSPQSDSPPMNISGAIPSQFSPLHDSRENWNETLEKLTLKLKFGQICMFTFMSTCILTECHSLPQSSLLHKNFPWTLLAVNPSQKPFLSRASRWCSNFVNSFNNSFGMEKAPCGNLLTSVAWTWSSEKWKWKPEK